MPKTPNSPSKTPPGSPKKGNILSPKSPRVTRNSVKQSAESKDSPTTVPGLNESLTNESTIGTPTFTSTQKFQSEEHNVNQQQPSMNETYVSFIVQDEAQEEFNQTAFENSDIAGKAILVKRCLPFYMHAFFDEVMDERLDKHCFTIENPLNPSVIQFKLETFEYQLLKALQTIKKDIQTDLPNEQSATLRQGSPEQTSTNQPIQPATALSKNTTPSNIEQVQETSKSAALNVESTKKKLARNTLKEKKKRKKRSYSPISDSDNGTDTIDEDAEQSGAEEEECSDDEEDDSNEDDNKYRNGKYGVWDKELFTKGKRRKRLEGEIVVRKCKTEPGCFYMESGSSNNIHRHAQNNHRGHKPWCITTYMQRKIYYALKNEYEEKELEIQEKINKATSSSKKKRKKHPTPRKYKESSPSSLESESDSDKRDKKKSKKSY